MKSRSLWIGIALLAAILLPALLAPLGFVSAPDEVRAERSLEAPQWSSDPLLGTDVKGRDLLARTLYGARVSLFVGLLGSLVALLIGVPYGAIAGLFGGRVDRLLMRIADALQSLPMVVVVLFLLSVLLEYRVELASVGIGRLELFFIALGALFWLPVARVARAESLRLRQHVFVDAARSMGAPSRRILWRHLLPHLLPSALVMLTLTVPRVVLMETFLSFLGLGVEPPAVSWGLLAAEGFATLNPLVPGWWLLIVPSLALVWTLYALNLIGDGLSESLRPDSKS